MTKLTMHLPLLCLSLLLTGCEFDDFGPSDRFQSDFHYSYPLSSGGKLTVENFNGSVEITGWDQNTVDISGVKYASTEPLRDAIRIDIQHSETSVNIRTVRPADGHGNLGARFVLKVPRKIELERITSSNGHVRVIDVEGPAHIRTSNGSIHTEKLTGNLEAQTSNGAIEAEGVSGGANLKTSNGRVRADAVQGPFEASTSNGGIHVHLANTASNAPMKLTTSNGPIDLTIDNPAPAGLRASTTNGSITLHLPGSTRASLHASTTNSSIASDFDVQKQSTSDKHHLEGTIGGGGALLDLSTSNGHIRLVRM
ncbi:MAG: DUF4097 family beta strand repeat-containing protein [Acidobacteriota bacterium]|nr:DUF4097 family beta strand repeat-containing protein [Acidobacteriota bacterium]